MLQPPTPKSVLLALLTSMNGDPAPVGRLVKMGEVFDFGESTVRVTLARLKRSGTIQTAGRGLYRLGPKAQPIRERIRTWHSREAQLCTWDGSWLAVHTAPVGGRALRRTLRAVHSQGFRRLEPGLQVRPNNLVRGANGVRQDLQGPEALDLAVFRLVDLDPDRDGVARTLWETDQLQHGYQAMLQRLADATARLDHIPPLEAARLTYVTYDAALRQILKDPLLPPELVDTDSRRRVTETTQVFYQTAVELWRELLR